MGDRNPIKFGPEWLRNLSRERTNTTPGNQGGGGAGGSTSGAGGGPPSVSSKTSQSSTGFSKVLLAKLRYGREEMLALYDRSAEPPPEVKLNDLYQLKGKPPFALNSFDDDVRDGMRSGGLMGGSSSERFGMGRGAGRGSGGSDARGRPRLPFLRQTSMGRGAPLWHGNSRGPNYMPEDDSALSGQAAALRPWSGAAGPSAVAGPSTSASTSRDQQDWGPGAGKMFRTKRQGNSTNWRQTNESDEWRSSESSRSRSNQDKDRDWSDRSSQDKQSWSSNRRTWVGGDSNDEMPEWALAGAETCGGTFDSSGAFHGYSNDDTSLPKTPDSPFTLSRSQTHGNFSRSKTAEEGSEEWWASKKSKKPPPKQLYPIDTNSSKKPSAPNRSSSPQPGTSKDEDIIEEREQMANEPHQSQPNPQDDFNKNNSYKGKFSESKTFDALMRSDINLEETSDSTSNNFQSVMITPNNSLRQKHQNIVSPVNEVGMHHERNSGILQMIQNHSQPQIPEKLVPEKSSKEKSVELIDMTFEESILSKMPSHNSNSMAHSPPSSMPQGMSSVVPSLGQMPNMQMRLQNQMSQSQMSQSQMSQNQMSQNQDLLKKNMSMSNMPAGLQQQSMQSIGIQNSALNASLRLPLGGPSNNPMVLNSNNMSMHPPNSTMGLRPTNSSMVLGPHNPMGMGSNNQMGIPMPGGPTQIQMSNQLHTSSLQNKGIPMPNQMPGQILGGPGISNQVSMSNQLSNSGMAGQMPSNNMSNQMSSQGMGGPVHQGGFPGMMPHRSNSNVDTRSLFLGQNSGPVPMPPTADIPMPNQTGLYPISGMPHNHASPFVYNTTERWYYEDPTKIIQGPFTSAEMDNWYRAGFFSPSLLIRRATDSAMRPLGSYFTVPFSPIDMIPFPLDTGFEPRQQPSHENLMNSQPNLGLDVLSIKDKPIMMSDNLQFGSVDLMRNSSYNQQQMVESLWTQPSSAPQGLWMQQTVNPRHDLRINNVNMFFWEQQQPSAIPTNSMLPEEITKEMKTEDQILAQLRASQNIPQPSGSQFGDVNVQNNTMKIEEIHNKMVPDLEELQKLLPKELTQNNKVETIENQDTQPKSDKTLKTEQNELLTATNNAKVQQQNNATKPQPAPEAAKQAKQTEKTAKNKENANTKSKNKKPKDEKLDEIKKEEDVAKKEKKEDASPVKSKKEDKLFKKELEKEKKEWLKEGFTIVKGSEKPTSKDTKKKPDDVVKVNDDSEKKRKEEERLAALDEVKRKKQLESAKKQQEQQQRQAMESASRRAPWSIGAKPGEGPSLQEIQRLEREHKLELMKGHQQAQQMLEKQQKEIQEMQQTTLAWSKKKSSNANISQSLAEIQAEARKQMAAVAVAMSIEDTFVPPPQTNNTPWGGFWDTQPAIATKPLAPVSSKPLTVVASKPQVAVVPTVVAAPVVEKAKEPPKPAFVEPPKPKKKPLPPKKETSPTAEFECWCNSVLGPWASKIDVPTFVGFLKDIESPYEVKDYVKCYLGETKDSSDFSRQFLERRSKLLRVGMVTPSDDLCSPAMAVNPRTISGLDYQEGKGKKVKKNKMVKLDARILGFSVTASEDRINVGDIDTV